MTTLRTTVIMKTDISGSTERCGGLGRWRADLIVDSGSSRNGPAARIGVAGAARCCSERGMRAGWSAFVG